ncbi:MULTISPECIES: bacteriocin-like protein [Chryseobacterium]|uniref:bacteriocin-like protein n=1 Tax=Chryseobacterium TaxID=59732 RepID=UPI003899ABE9
MKNLKKLSKNDLKMINGGKQLQPLTTHCFSNAGCPSGQICVTCSGPDCGSLGSGICI